MFADHRVWLCYAGSAALHEIATWEASLWHVSYPRSHEIKNKTEDNQKEIKMMNEKGNATHKKRREQKDIMARKK